MKMPPSLCFPNVLLAVRETFELPKRPAELCRQHERIMFRMKKNTKRDTISIITKSSKLLIKAI